MSRRSALVFLTVCFSLVACEETPRDQSVRIANIQPPVKVRPSPVTGPGTIINGWMGVDALVSLSDEDRAKNRQAESRAFTAQIGQQITWINEDNGDSGNVTPIKDEYAANGTYCREFQQSVTMDSRKLHGHATACQQPDGSWQTE